MATTVSPHAAGDIQTDRLFHGSCVSLIATSVAFAVVGAVMLQLKAAFVLTNEEVGWIAGAALWGFSVSQLIFSPLCDNLGFRFLLRLAFVCHLVGVAVMVLASGFWMLFAGAWIISGANGLVEAACNPLVVSLYPNNKTVKLNRFHVWFPGGIVIGSVAAYLLDQVGIGAWQVKLALILIPTLAYGFLMLREKFPDTEGVRAGISMGEMFKATFTTPFFWLLFACMAITASTELGPNRWIPPVLQSGGIPGILVLAYISGLMAILRYNAGVIVHRFSPTGVLLMSAILGAIGLYWFSFAETTLVAFLSATVFAVGVCFFWPTMLGVTSERVPRSGAFGLGLMGAFGMLIVGVVTTPWMGHINDMKLNDVIPVEQTVTLLQNTADTFPVLANQAQPEFRSEITGAGSQAQAVVSHYVEFNALPSPGTANALRAITGAQTAVASTNDAKAEQIVTAAQGILGPADNYGGRMSFRAIVPFTCVLILVFGILYFRDRSRGGYKVEHLTQADLQDAQQKAAVSA
ncbi:MAG TPA: MFS transporter [Rhodothermales bacterium]|nr:MFS transporter [Rhodothermales bacterium]